MPSSSVLTFTEPDAYFATIRTAEVKGAVTARGDYRAELTSIELHRLWMQLTLPTAMPLTCKGDCSCSVIKKRATRGSLRRTEEPRAWRSSDSPWKFAEIA